MLRDNWSRRRIRLRALDAAVSVISSAQEVSISDIQGEARLRAIWRSAVKFVNGGRRRRFGPTSSKACLKSTSQALSKAAFSSALGLKNHFFNDASPGMLAPVGTSVNQIDWMCA